MKFVFYIYKQTLFFPHTTAIKTSRNQQNSQLVDFVRAKMFDIKFRAAKNSDLSAIRDFVDENFHDKEPIEQSHIDKNDKMKPDDDFLLDCIDCETSLMAFDSDKLAAVLLAGKIHPNEAERNLECAKHIESKKAADILKFLSFIDAKADYCNRLKVSNCLHVHIITVHPRYHRQGIARKLFELCIEIGRRKKFPAITMDCTNLFTSRIAEKFAFTHVSTVTYDEYNESLGEKVFVAREPHTDIKSYAKVLGKNL